jgi:hypothetical protein
MFRALCAHHQEVKLYYTSSGIVTPVGSSPVHRLRVPYMFRALCAHHQEAKLYYTASGIVTPVGGHPVRRLKESSLHVSSTVGILSQPVHRTATYRRHDTRRCIKQF